MTGGFLRGSWSIFKHFWWATQNLLMFAFLIFLVISFKKLAQKVWVQNTQTGRQWDLRKISYVKMKTKSTQLYSLIDKLHNVKEGIYIPNNACHRKRKKKFTHHSNDCSEQNMFHQKLESYRFILPLKKFDQCKLKQNVVTSKMCILRKMVPKRKRYNNFIVHANLPQLWP